MKLKCLIINDLHPHDQSNMLLVKFDKDEKRQPFEIYCDFHPYSHRMRKMNVWTLYLKLESESYIDKDTGAIRYHTYLRCHKATEEKGDNR